MNSRLISCSLIIVSVLLTLSPAVAKAELIDNGNGTITDTASGLMWLKNADTNGLMNWAAANAWAQSLNSSSFAGYSDWRLPSGANRDGSGTICNSYPAGANCTGTEFATLYLARLIMASNPGPFQNLRAGSYWTSTDVPGNPAQAMAQDFVDGGQNPFSKSSSLYAWAVRDARPIVVPPETPLLYGVVSGGPNAGALILIDTQNAAASIIGSTGFENACGLAFDSIHSKLYLSPCFGQAGIHVINLTPFQATPLGTLATGVTSIAHRLIDDRIYGVDLGPTLLSLDTLTGGSDLVVVGIINKSSVGGIATRPSDGQLFGVGFTESNSQQLFRLKHTYGNGPRDTNVASVNWDPIRALTFHPDGRLFATDGKNLLTLDPSNGVVLSHLAFSGVSLGIGNVNALAVSGPRVPDLLPDVWIKDCAADTGVVPSSPRPCSESRRSPDIMIDNNGDGAPERIVYGHTNIVRITVRNRGFGLARGVVVRLYAYRSGTTPSISNLVGQRTVDIGPGPNGIANVSIPWKAPSRVQRGSVQCFAVVLDHPRDRVNPSTSPSLDNNKAVTCIGLVR